jgi:hypothetical protein
LVDGVAVAGAVADGALLGGGALVTGVGVRDSAGASRGGSAGGLGGAGGGGAGAGPSTRGWTLVLPTLEAQPPSAGAPMEHDTCRLPAAQLAGDTVS